MHVFVRGRERKATASFRLVGCLRETSEGRTTEGHLASPKIAVIIRRITHLHEKRGQEIHREGEADREKRPSTSDVSRNGLASMITFETQRSEEGKRT